MRTLALTVVLLSTIATTRAADFLSTHARTEPLIATVAAPSKTRFLAFTDQPLDVQARLFVGSAATVDAEWWRNVSWQLLRDGQPSRVVTPADVRFVASSRSSAPPRQILYAAFVFPPLPPRSYGLQAFFVPGEGKPLRSETFRFDMRVGTEDRDTRRAYLRSTSDRVASTPAPDRYARFRELMLELASLEPKNPSVWERLGDVSAGVAPPTDTAAHYARALEMAERNVREKFAGRVPQSAQQSLDASRENLTVFARAMPHMRDDVTVVVTNRRGKKRVLLYAAGNLIQTIE